MSSWIARSAGCAPRPSGPGASRLPLEALAAWALPPYGRSDILAKRYQSWYLRAQNATFLLAAAAVATAATQILFLPRYPALVWVEVSFMVALLGLVFLGRQWRLHEHWICYRFLAERIRSALFLAACDQTRRERESATPHLGHEWQRWLRSAFSEVWEDRPRLRLAESDVEGLRELLATAWIDEQSAFYASTSLKHRKRHMRLNACTTTSLLFLATIVAAILHAQGVGGHPEGSLSLPHFWELFAIALAALGAVVERGDRLHGVLLCCRSHHVAVVSEEVKLGRVPSPRGDGPRAIALVTRL
jgi:hypothetical protein